MLRKPTIAGQGTGFLSRDRKQSRLIKFTKFFGKRDIVNIWFCFLFVCLFFLYIFNPEEKEEPRIFLVVTCGGVKISPVACGNWTERQKAWECCCIRLLRVEPKLNPALGKRGTGGPSGEGWGVTLPRFYLETFPCEKVESESGVLWGQEVQSGPMTVERF